jgi:uncharacterized protein (DUF2384 family)
MLLHQHKTIDDIIYMRLSESRSNLGDWVELIEGEPNSQPDVLGALVAPRAGEPFHRGQQYETEEVDFPVISLVDEAMMLTPGISGSTLKFVTQHIPRDIVIRTVGSDSTNIAKLFRKKHLSKSISDDVNDLTRLWQELNTFFEGDQEMLSEWICTNLPALEGEKPETLMDSFVGRNAIKKCLNKMRYGDF